MAAKVTADPDARTITVTEAPTNGVVSLDVVEDIYSPLKDDWLATPTLHPLRFPFRTFGDETGAGQIGPYVFFDNVSGWRMVPFDDDHEVSLVGNLIPESAIQGITRRVWNDRPGRTVSISEKTSAQALTRVTGSGVTEQDKDDIALKARVEILDNSNVDALSLTELMRLMAAVWAGDVVKSGDSYSLRARGDAQRERIAATVDESGNRTITAVDVDP